MYSVSKIAFLSGLNYNLIYRVIKELKIEPASRKQRKTMFTEAQMFLIFEFLYCENKLDFYFMESKANNPDPETVFYSRLDFLKNGNIIAKK